MKSLPDILKLHELKWVAFSIRSNCLKVIILMELLACRNCAIVRKLLKRAPFSICNFRRKRPDT